MFVPPRMIEALKQEMTIVNEMQKEIELKEESHHHMTTHKMQDIDRNSNGPLAKVVSSDDVDDVLALIPAIPQHTQEIHLTYAKISSIPTQLFQFTLLMSLDLSHNAIEMLPLNFSHLRTLEVLHLDYNKLSTLPSVLKQLERLRIVTVSHNFISQVDELANWLQGHHILEKLDLSCNPIESIPSSLSQLSSVALLHFTECSAPNTARTVVLLSGNKFKT